MANTPNPNQQGGFADPEKVRQATEYVKQLKAKIEETVRPIKDMADGMKKFTDQNDAVRKMAENFHGLSASGVAASVSLVEALKGFARAGLEGTGQMAMLDFQTQQLARGVAAVFLPAIETAMDIVRRLSDWFHSLSESQQNALQGLAVGAGVAKAAMSVLPGPLGLVAGGLAAVLTGTEAGQAAMDKLGAVFSGVLDALKPLLNAIGNVFASALDAASPLLEILTANLAAVMEGVRPLIDLIGRGLAENFKWVGSVLKSLMPVFDELRGAFGEVMDSLTELYDAFKPIIDAFSEGFKQLMTDVLVPVLKFIVHQFVEGIRKLIEYVEKAVAVLMAIKKLGMGALDVDALRAEVQAQYDAMQDRKRERRNGGAAGPDKPGRQVTPGGGQFEDVSNAFKRLQQAAFAGGKSHDERAADAAEETAKHTKKTSDLLEKKFGQPAPAKPAPPQ